MQNSVICTRMTSVYGFQPSSAFFFMQNSDFRTRLTSLYWSHTSSVVLSTHISVLSTRIKRLYGFQPSPVVCCMQISDFNTRMASLYGFQLSSVVLFMQNSDFKTNLYWSQPSSVVFACKTSTFGPAFKSLWVPDITCRFVHAKQHDEHLNYLSLCVPALICGFCMQNSVLRAKIACLYGSQSSTVIFCMQISDFSTWNTSLYWSQPSSVGFACKTATLGPAYKSPWVPDITCHFVHAKQSDEHLNYLSLCVPALICCFCKQSILEQNYKSPWVPDLICGFWMQNSDFWTSIQVSMGTRHNLSFCACKTAWLAPEIPVSMCSSPHLWFLHAKQRP